MTPARPPGPAEFRVLRRATRDYLVVLDAALLALEAAPPSWSELRPLRTALTIATGKSGGTFGSPHNICVLLDRLLGESGYSPEETP